MTSLFQTRHLVTYYVLFISGALVLVYQACGFQFLGDSVNVLVLFFLAYGIGTRRWLHILENSLLLTLGYILPLLIRNSIKLTHDDVPSVKTFLQLAAVSSSTTLLIGFCCTGLSFGLYKLLQLLKKSGRSPITIKKN